MSTERLYILDARNILKGLLLLVNFSSDNNCPDFNVKRIVIKVRMKPETVKPIAPRSDAKSELFEVHGNRKKLYFSKRNNTNNKIHASK